MPDRPSTIVRCPKCCAAVTFSSDLAICRSSKCRLAFPITRGIPEMLIDNAQGLSADVWAEHTTELED